MKTETPPSAPSDPSAPSALSSAERLSPLVLALVVLAGICGVGERLWLTSLAPRYAYLTDHLDNIQMGRAAGGVQDTGVARELGRLYESRRGGAFTDEDFARFGGKGVKREFNLFHVYGMAPEQLPIVWADSYPGGSQAPPGMFARVAIRKVNYPPLGETVFWLESSLLDAVAPGRPVNTFTSRLVMSLASILGEILASVAAFLVARRFLSRNLSLVAAAAIWLLPPMAMDSSFWGQTDSWFIAPALFTIWLMFQGRWIGAGVLSAVTLLLKPQGLFLGPIVLFAAAVLRGKTGTGTVPAGRSQSPLSQSPFFPAFLKRVALSVGAGAGALFLLTLPWTIADGGAWLQQAYISNFTLYSETTMKAFNVWYLDALLHAGDLTPVLDTAGTIGGITKQSWGTLLTAASLLGLCYLFYRKYPRPAASSSPNRAGPFAVLLFSALWLWSTFMWPTKVHERYIMYSIPLVLLCALRLRRLWPAAIVLVLVGSAELCHNVWLKAPPGNLVNPRYVKNVYEQMIEYGRQHGGGIPTREDALQYVQDKARQERAGYMRDRGRTAGLEYLLTLGSILAYGWAFASPFLKLGGEETPLPAQQKPKPPVKRK